MLNHCFLQLNKKGGKKSEKQLGWTIFKFKHTFENQDFFACGYWKINLSKLPIFIQAKPDRIDSLPQIPIDIYFRITATADNKSLAPANPTTLSQYHTYNTNNIQQLFDNSDFKNIEVYFWSFCHKK